MRPRQALAGALAAIAIVGLLVLVRSRDEERTPAPAPAALAPPELPSDTAPRPADLAPSPPEADGTTEVERLARGLLPRSLRGTDVDGGLGVDADGHLVVHRDVLATFAYFLSASGEEPDAVLRQRILDHIHAQLDEPAASEAIALLDQYLGFREAVRELAQGGEVPHDLERRLQWLRELRREHFGTEHAEILFGEEEQALRVDLERRLVATDPDLAPGERAARMAALEEELPERVREARRRARAPGDAMHEAEALRAGGASEAEIFAMREARFGPEAAERLAALDAERAAWNARLGAYQAERDALRGEAAERGLDEATVSDQLEALRREHFEPDELLRVRALDGFDPGGA